MTTERRTLIEPKDVLAIELECKLCHSRVQHKLAKIQVDRFQNRLVCPNCREDLILSGDEGPDMMRLGNFIEALRALLAIESRAIIRLEIPSEPIK